MEKIELPQILVDDGYKPEYIIADTHLSRIVAASKKYEDLDREKWVAIKTPKRNGMGGEKERFKNEARILLELKHPNLVNFVDFKRDESNHYLIVELVNGLDLKKILKGFRRLPLEFISAIIYESCVPLDFIHQRGIIHRDIKSSNIMVAYDGTLKLADFGIVKNGFDASLTTIEDTLGTPSYMSPEQISDPTAVKPQSDIFSLGIVIYELLTGVRPFDGVNTNTTIANILKCDYVYPQDPKKLIETIPKNIAKIVKKCIAPKVEERYQNALELKEDIDKIYGFKNDRNIQEILRGYINSRNIWFDNLEDRIEEEKREYEKIK